MVQPIIVTDSTADIPFEMVQEYGITVVPMQVLFGDESFLEGVNLTAEQFYARLLRTHEMPTTTQTSPSKYAEVYRSLLMERSEAPIISIHISSGMSGTYQSALLGKAMLEEELGRSLDITVIDSLSASYGFGLQVVAAARLGVSGASVQDIVEEIERLRKARHLYFLVDTMEYLQKGGRVGRAAALLGNLLNIKPILSVDEEGVIYAVDKARGRKKAVNRIIELFVKDYGDHKDINVSVCDGANDELAEEFVTELSKHFTLHEIVRSDIGAVVGTHVGPGIVAVYTWPA